MKKILKITLIVLLLIAGAGVLYLDATEIAPKRVRIRTETIRSEKIPEALSGLQILFFSDVHYNAFVDDSRLESLIEKIDSVGADVILFGGDLFDHPANQWPDDQAMDTIRNVLSRLKAPLGKFAVLGNHDLESQSSGEMVSHLLFEAGFEVLNNQSVKIRNRGTQSISLVGLESEMLGNPDPEAAYQNISPDSFTIALCHTPDTVLRLPQDQTDLMLAGHSHGGQIYIPLLDTFYRANYAEIYYRGKHQVDDILLDVSNGTGTTRMDVRLFSPAEIVVYRLEHTEPAPETDSVPDNPDQSDGSNEAGTDENPDGSDVPQDQPAENPEE